MSRLAVHCMYHQGMLCHVTRHAYYALCLLQDALKKVHCFWFMHSTDMQRQVLANWWLSRWANEGAEALRKGQVPQGQEYLTGYIALGLTGVLMQVCMSGLQAVLPAQFRFFPSAAVHLSVQSGGHFRQWHV